MNWPEPDFSRKISGMAEIPAGPPVAFLEDSRLIFSVEAEKDSNYRYSAISVAEVLDAVGQLNAVPDVICMSGWWAIDHHEFLHGSHRNGGYRGVSAEGAIMDKGRLLGGRADYFSSSHERAHILCAFGMSAAPKGTPTYALIWEGEMGSFYEIDPDFNITLIADVMGQPGNRYGLLYGLADPMFPKDGPFPRSSDAGKLMALPSFGSTANVARNGHSSRIRGKGPCSSKSMSRISKRRPTPSRPAVPPDDPDQSGQFLAKAREIEAHASPEEFERAFRKVALGQLSHPRQKRRRN